MYNNVSNVKILDTYNVILREAPYVFYVYITIFSSPVLQYFMSPTTQDLECSHAMYSFFVLIIMVLVFLIRNNQYCNMSYYLSPLIFIHLFKFLFVTVRETWYNCYTGITYIIIYYFCCCCCVVVFL
jgi:hypothetical protein